MTKSWKTLLLGAVGAMLLSAGALQADTRIQGSGATFPAPLYAKWVEGAYNKLHPDVKVDYQAVGSGAGIKAVTDRTVQFGALRCPDVPPIRKKPPPANSCTSPPSPALKC